MFVFSGLVGRLNFSSRFIIIALASNDFLISEAGEFAKGNHNAELINYVEGIPRLKSELEETQNSLNELTQVHASSKENLESSFLFTTKALSGPPIIP